MARRHRSAALVAACSLVLLAAPTLASASRPIYVENQSATVSDDALRASLPAFQDQIDLDL